MLIAICIPIDLMREKQDSPRVSRIHLGGILATSGGELIELLSLPEHRPSLRGVL